MCENVKIECSCMAGYDKGAIKKTIENNIFTIFGNLNQNSSIVIRYHGLLTEHHSENYTIFYYFDNYENDKKYITLNKCTKCIGECYCCSIDLKEHDSISFGFVNDDNQKELNQEEPFCLKIMKDPISSIMQRYGFEANTKLPVVENNTCGMSFKIYELFNTIKTFFSTLITKRNVR